MTRYKDENAWSPLMVKFDLRLMAMILLERGCESSTIGLGSCWLDPQRSAASPYGAEQVCPGCLAYAALRNESAS